MQTSTPEIATMGEDPRSSRATWTVEEAAKYLGISRPTAYIAVHNQEIPCIKLGRRILVPVAALKRMLDVTVGATIK